MAVNLAVMSGYAGSEGAWEAEYYTARHVHEQYSISVGKLESQARELLARSNNRRPGAPGV
ncbi:hypothetical protein Krac_12454 [Ktedonobacter racemifer DSM 44963]|uniref:Uncharacterized protein n=1 Tax=Ktedonobacter racemifer DSM 44963 TaxID=485913 RepID=D6TH71_KTERA|nr:hypothetical protein Krac_12454 [Ktedonobacter racemifer DSM 44963]